MNTRRHIVFCCGCHANGNRLESGFLGVEVYLIDGPDAEDQIDMASLNDLVTPLSLAFVGGKEARRFAELYSDTWIQDGPDSEADILHCWGISRD